MTRTTEAFAFTETDRTKSKWVSSVYRDFVNETGRARTTLRGLFYFALQRKASDYPICGGFVGEIRITRPYHENDGEKLAKWAGKARTLGFIPADALLEEKSGMGEKEIFLPISDSTPAPRREVWTSKPSLNPLLYPVCKKHNATLISVESGATAVAVDALCRRGNSPAQILCLSDLSAKGAFFARELAAAIKARQTDGCAAIEVRSLGLHPQQILDWKIPMIQAGRGSGPDKESKEERNAFKRYLQSFGLDGKGMAEIDALEVYYPGGIAAFLDEMLSRDRRCPPEVL
jgi:hypothetical protein